PIQPLSPTLVVTAATQPPCSLSLSPPSPLILFFFFNDTAPTEIYTLSLHDALPIWWCAQGSAARGNPKPACCNRKRRRARSPARDRKSTRLNSSHVAISYAVFCLKKKKKKQMNEEEHVRKSAYVLEDKAEYYVVCT